jgi:hypothetical protein
MNVENKKIITVWNERELLLPEIRNSIVNSFKLNLPIDESISDIFFYDVVENEKDIRLIIKYL